MARDNNITIIGNLTRDPELRFTPGGAAVTDMGVAWNENRRNKDTQEWDSIPSYFDITCWSFDSGKTIITGEGGMITSNNRNIGKS